MRETPPLFWNFATASMTVLGSKQARLPARSAHSKTSLLPMIQVRNI